MSYLNINANLVLAATLMVTGLSVDASLVRDSTSEKLYQYTLEDKDPVYIFIQKDLNSCKPIYPLKLTDHVIELLSIDDLYNEHDTFSDVVEKTQKKWLSVVQGKSMQTSSSATMERNDLVDSPEKTLIKDKVEKIARAMGLFDQRNPTFVSYKYGAWLGAYLASVRHSLHELIKIWELGCRFEKLVVFTGERYLKKADGQEDDIKKLIDPSLSPLPFKKNWKLPQNVKYETEYDMMQLVLDQTELPEGMVEALNDKIEFINTPKGAHARPGTKDCYVMWLNTNPEEGTVLATSHPLYWVHQQISGKAILGSRFPLDTVAPTFSQEKLIQKNLSLVSLVHDTVAKCLYEISKQYDVKAD